MSLSEDILNTFSGGIANNPESFKIFLILLITISWYNVLELIVLLFMTFKRWNGLYFWSLLVASCMGVFPYMLGFILQFLTNASPALCVTVWSIGWCSMVTGQSVVLYSRLNLVVQDERILRCVLYLIVSNVVLLHVPTTVLMYGSNGFERRLSFIKAYIIMEKIQLTGFSFQEALISFLYVWETIKLLQLSSDRKNRSIMHQLVGINVAMFAMDLLLLGLEYADHYALQIMLKGVVYSIKLKLEFAVLGRLVDVVQSHKRFSFGDPMLLSSVDYGDGRRQHQA